MVNSKYSIENRFILWYISIAPSNHEKWFKNDVENKIKQLNSKYKSSFFHDLFEIDSNNVKKEINIIQNNLQNRRSAMDKTFENYVRMTGGIAKDIINHYIDFLKNKEYENDTTIESSAECDFRESIGFEIYVKSYSDFNSSSNNNSIEDDEFNNIEFFKADNFQKKSKDIINGLNKNISSKDIDDFGYIISSLKGWQKLLFDKINECDSEMFGLSQIYEFIPEFREKYPNNHRIKSTIRATLQQLRDLGLIQFVSRGKYKNLAYSIFENRSKI